MTTPRPDNSGRGVDNPSRGPGRRTLIGGGLASLAAAGAGVVVGSKAVDGSPADSDPNPNSPTSAAELRYSLHGARQAGIAQTPQPWATLVAFTFLGEGTEDLRRLMRIWTDDGARLMSGEGPLTDQEVELAQLTAGLTITVGWGPSLFAKAGVEASRPDWAKPLPDFTLDQLDPAYVGGDLILQVAAHSPMTVAHAERELTVAATGLAEVAWIQEGFREPMERDGWPMRNLFGQVDGTVQPDIDGLDEDLVWIPANTDEAWADGSAMVVRRIKMDMPSWDRADRPGRENAIGRRLSDGSPLTGGEPDADADLAATDDVGLSVINPAAHIRRAAAAEPHERFLRRPYQYHQRSADGVSMDTGLIFIAFQADPVRQFVPVQQRLDEADLLNIWTVAVGSAVFAILPGVPRGGYLGQQFL